MVFFTGGGREKFFLSTDQRNCRKDSSLEVGKLIKNALENDRLTLNNLIGPQLNEIRIRLICPIPDQVKHHGRKILRKMGVPFRLLK